LSRLLTVCIVTVVVLAGAVDNVEGLLPHQAARAEADSRSSRICITIRFWSIRGDRAGTEANSTARSDLCAPSQGMLSLTVLHVLHACEGGGVGLGGAHVLHRGEYNFSSVCMRNVDYDFCLSQPLQ
jgi:hypothetical protein